MMVEKYLEKFIISPAGLLSVATFVFLVIASAIIGILRRSKENKKRKRSKKAFRYEYDVARYLRRHMFWDVRVTRASGDYGVDVTARKGLFRKYAVQCKYYSSPVGVGAVQEVVAGMKVYNCNRSMVVTNNVFTRPAQKLAEENDVVLLSGVRG